MRLFVGLPLDAHATAHLARFTEPLKRGTPNLRWAKPESWHVTLQFLGSTTNEQYTALVTHLRAIQAIPPIFTLHNTGAFDRAGIFYAAVEPTPSLLALHEAVVHATAHAGFIEEDRGYRPHITLARRRGRERSTELRRLSGKPLAPLKQIAHEFLLYESHLSPAGSEYTVRERFPLQ